MDKNTLISAAGLFAAVASLAGSQLAMLLLRTYATWKVSIAPREKPDKNMTEKQELTLSEILQFYKIYATYIRSGMSPSDQVQDNREMKNLHSKLCEIGRITIAETAASILLYLQLTALCTNLLSQIVTLVLIWKLTIFEIMPWWFTYTFTVIGGGTIYLLCRIISSGRDDFLGDFIKINDGTPKQWYLALWEWDQLFTGILRKSIKYNSFLQSGLPPLGSPLIAWKFHLFVITLLYSIAMGLLNFAPDTSSVSRPAIPTQPAISPSTQPVIPAP